MHGKTMFSRRLNPQPDPAPTEVDAAALAYQRRDAAAKIRQRTAVLLRNDAAYLRQNAAASGDAELILLAAQFGDVRDRLERRAGKLVLDGG
ncbi:MAG: hypothetical protein M0Z43_13585 [Acidithiobacillus sp.]|nr:hypothetical protein [Acidithiobacillus sp.]